MIQVENCFNFSISWVQTDKEFYARRFGWIPEDVVYLWEFLCCVLIDLTIKTDFEHLGKYSMTV